MRITAIAVACIITAPLLAQPSSSYRITHTLRARRRRQLGLPRPRPAASSRVHRRGRTASWSSTRTRGKLLGEVTGIQGAHGTAIAAAHRTRLRHVRRTTVGGDVRSEDVQDARPDSRGGRRRRDHLRRRVEPRLHVQRRRAFLHRDRSARGQAASPTSRSAASRSTACRRATARSTRTSPTPAKSWRSTRRPRPSRADGPPRRASSRSRWRSTPRIIACSAAAAAA